ncbi:MAG TPA: hypothetical protein VF119_02850, partial [Candidatus Limnocylindrales bacterium]
RARHRLARAVAVGSVLSFGWVVVIDTLDGWPLGIWQVVAVALNTTIGLVYLGLGLLLIERRPATRIGPLLLLVGVVYAVFGPVDHYLSFGLEQAWVSHAALLISSSGYLISTLLAVALILFPDGSPPSRRWWAIIAIIALGGAVGVIALAFGPSTFAPFYPTIQSPFAVAGFPKGTLIGMADTVSAMGNVAGLAAVAIRWWRGDRVVRAQTTWVLGAVVITFAINRFAVQVDTADELATWLVGLIQNASVCLLPIAMAIAILRYRLYEIDRIVSRTIGYAVVTAVLFGVFFAVNVALQRVLGDAVGAAPVVVAGSTLVVAALFQPLRVRVQRAVDRRFHRTRYDAERTVAGFSGRLRDPLDLPTLTAELRRTTTDAVEPAATTVWLRAKGSVG